MRSAPRFIPYFAAAAGVLFGAPAAFGAGYYIGDVGARGMARGGAFIAAPDSLLALHYNPAGLSLLRGLQVEFDYWNVNLDMQYQRACPCVDSSVPNAAMLDSALQAGFKPAINSAEPQQIPYLSIAYGLPFLNTTVALGAYGLSSPGRLKFGEQGPSSNLQAQRYTAIDLQLYEAFWTLAAAFEPLSGLRLGGGLMIYDFHASQSAHLWANSATFGDGMPERSDLDIPVVVAFKKNTQLNWSLGASYSSPIPGLSLGASALGLRSIRAPGTASIQLPPSLAGVATVTGSQIEVEIELPPEIRFGIEYAIKGVARIEAAAVIEGWSNHRSVVIRSQDIFVSTPASPTPVPLNTITIVRKFNNSTSLRLGGELNLLEPMLGIRAGVFYEPSAVPDVYRDPSTPDLDKIGIGFGLSTQWFGATLELGGQYVLMSDTTVTNSDQRLNGVLQPPSGSNTYLTAIGNGVYSGHYLIFGASLSISADKLLGSL